MLHLFKKKPKRRGKTAIRQKTQNKQHTLASFFAKVKNYKCVFNVHTLVCVECTALGPAAEQSRAPTISLLPLHHIIYTRICTNALIEYIWTMSLIVRSLCIFFFVFFSFSSLLLLFFFVRLLFTDVLFGLTLFCSSFLNTKYSCNVACLSFSFSASMFRSLWLCVVFVHISIISIDLIKYLLWFRAVSSRTRAWFRVQCAMAVCLDVCTRFVFVW